MLNAILQIWHSSLCLMLKAFLKRCVLCVLAIGFACHADQLPVIDELLEIEKIRKTDVEGFQKSLIDFQIQYQNQSIPKDVNCLFEYLRIYSESFNGIYSESREAVNQLLKKCNDQFDTVIRGKSLLASLQVISGAYYEAIINLNDVIELAEDSTDEYLKAQIHHLASRTYRLINQDDLGSKYANLLISLNENPENVCFGEYNLYRIKMRADFSQVNPENIKAASKNCRLTNNLIPALFLQFDLFRYGVNIQDQQHANMAVEELYGLKEDVEKTKFKNIKVYYQALLGHVAWLAGREEEAIKWASLAIKENATIGDSEQLIMALSVLIDVSIQNQDFAASYRYLEQKSKIEKSLFEQKLAKQVAYFQVKHANLA